MIYLGLASLVYLGMKEEYAAARWKHSARIRALEWLSGRVKFLDSAKAGDFFSLISSDLNWDKRANTTESTPE
jgi:hypothetical protein